MWVWKVHCLCVSCVCTAVVYDGCPKAFDAGIWWPRTSFGRPVAMNCPKGSIGECRRLVLQESGCWISKSVFTNTHTVHWHFYDRCTCTQRLNKFHSSNITHNLKVNKLTHNLEVCCNKVGKLLRPNDDFFTWSRLNKCILNIIIKQSVCSEHDTVCGCAVFTKGT